MSLAKLDVQSVKELLHHEFSSNLPLASRTEPHLLGALRQTLECPGSLVRSQLVNQMAGSFGMEPDRALELATAVEYFHTASLIFDDLPCMDDATERRGEPCVHIAYGEPAAILAALALINRAYALLWRAARDSSPDRQSAALAYIEKHLGVDGLLNGQSKDIHFAGLAGGQVSPEEVALGKTVSLIRISLVVPALLGGARTDEARLLERLAIFWGLSYQILDDLKDVFQQPGQTGKTTSRDASLERPNIALAIGAKKAILRLDRLMRLGDLTLLRLKKRLSSLSFLDELRLRFEEEIGNITSDNSFANP